MNIVQFNHYWPIMYVILIVCVLRT